MSELHDFDTHLKRQRDFTSSFEMIKINVSGDDQKAQDYLNAEESTSEERKDQKIFNGV